MKTPLRRIGAIFAVLFFANLPRMILEIRAAQDDAAPVAVVSAPADATAGGAIELSAKRSKNADAFDWIVGNSDAGIVRAEPDGSRVRVMLPQPGSYTVWLFAARGSKIAHIRYVLTVNPALDPRPDPVPDPLPNPGPDPKPPAPAPPQPAPKPPEPVAGLDWRAWAQEAAKGRPADEAAKVGICFRTAAVLVPNYPNRDDLIEAISDAMADQLGKTYIQWVPFKAKFFKALHGELDAGRNSDLYVAQSLSSIADALKGNLPAPPNPGPQPPAPAPADAIPASTPLFVVTVTDIDAAPAERSKVTAVIFSDAVRKAADSLNCRFVNLTTNVAAKWPGIAAAGAALGSKNYYVVMTGGPGGSGQIVRKAALPGTADDMIRALQALRGK